MVYKAGQICKKIFIVISGEFEQTQQVDFDFIQENDY